MSQEPPANFNIERDIPLSHAAPRYPHTVLGWSCLATENTA